MSDAHFHENQWAAQSRMYAAENEEFYSIFATLKPRIFIDGNQWCVLYGENLQDGVAGFGDSPADAVRDFNSAWSHKLAPTKPAGTTETRP